MKIQYSKLIEHIYNVSIVICTLSILIGLINLFTKFLSPLFYNLIVSAFTLSVTGFAVSDLYLIVSQKNIKLATTESTSIFKIVFGSIIFYFCSLCFALFLFFGFFGYEKQAIFLSVLFSSGVSYFGYYREQNIIKNNKTKKSKIEKIAPIDLSFLMEPTLIYSALYFSIAFLTITLVHTYILPLSSKASVVCFLTSCLYMIFFATDLRSKTIFYAIGGIVTVIFLSLSNII